MIDAQHEVFRHLREAQNRYTYFMLGAAGAALAFAVTQTQGETMKWSLSPLGVAVLCWGLSFFCGARQLAYVGSTLYANLALLQVEAGLHPVAGEHPQMIQAASAGIRSAIDENSERAGKYGVWQFRLLAFGALLYVVWHVLEMWLRTPQPG